MAKIEELAEQIKRILGARTDDSDLDERDLKLNIKQSLAYIVRTRYFTSKQDDIAEIDGSLISRFKGVPVLLEADTGLYYSEMPCDVMSMPYGGGITSVSPTGDAKTSYKQVPFNFNDLYKGLDSFSLEQQIGYYLEEARCYYVGLNAGNVIDTVIMRILIGVDNLNDDKSFNIPADMEKEVIDYVVNLYQNWQPTDITNNSEDQG